jgi:NRAMP (natural resistance-associated macrophage protein)-like metal ion transporter
MFTTKLKKFLKAAGPGIISGSADNDPAGISVYSLSGATVGFSQLWLLLLSTPLLINTQAICARIGDVKKKGLAAIFRQYYGREITYGAALALICANLATIGADFVGIAAALGLLFPKISLIFFLPVIAFLLWYVIVFKSYIFIRRIFFVFAALLTSYILAGFVSQPDWNLVLKNTFLPSFSYQLSYWTAAVALLGTTITPFLFFWQASVEVEEHRNSHEAKKETSEIALGMIFSNIVSYFIIVTCATFFWARGIQIETAADAAQALRPLAGDFSFILFSLGMIGSGLLAIPVIASSTAYAVSEVFGWREGLDQLKHFF